MVIESDVLFLESTLLLFVWINTLIASLAVLSNIPLRQNPLRVDVAGIQAMQ